jgi:hypothetical protein
MFQQPHKHLFAGAAVAGVAVLDRDVRADVECLAHLVFVADVRAVGLVVLEVVDDAPRAVVLVGCAGG